MSDPRLTPQPWMTLGETRQVMAALNREREVARFVGGCVRNALLGEAVEDIDIATSLTPQEVIRKLTDAGLRVIETGLAHGTVTAIAQGKPFEITTLRIDVETDGRRANVAFTDDWARDAARRDFTINGLFANEAGMIFDFVGGLSDIAAHRVRFIGNPDARIAEDYLRILRFFRFSAWYGAEPLDGAGMDAIKRHLDGLGGLSAERVQKEFLRLLAAPEPVHVLREMEKCGVLGRLLPQATHLDVLHRLIGGGAPGDPLARLSALIGAGAAPGVSALLRLSNAMADRLALLTRDDLVLEDDRARRHALYRFGREVVIDIALLMQARGTLSGEALKAVLVQAKLWNKPAFPLSGDDVLARGIAPGPAVGDMLRALETWWIDESFHPDRTALEARLDALAKKSAG